MIWLIEAVSKCIIGTSCLYNLEMSLFFHIHFYDPVTEQVQHHHWPCSTHLLHPLSCTFSLAGQEHPTCLQQIELPCSQLMLEVCVEVLYVTWHSVAAILSCCTDSSLIIITLEKEKCLKCKDGSKNMYKGFKYRMNGLKCRTEVLSCR